MKRFALYRIALTMGALLALCTGVNADVQTYIPYYSDLQDLDHSYYYAWNLDIDIPEGESIVAASLTFENIYNWQDENFDLYVRMLDYVPDASYPNQVKRYYDNSASGDAFAASGSFGDTYLLAHWDETDGTIPVSWSTRRDVTYAFSEVDLAHLTELMDANTFGLGFDPDCHFYNDKVLLTVETAPPGGPDPNQPVPEPATLLLLASGMLGYAGWRRRMSAS